MRDKDEAKLKRVRLTGTRFDGGRLPIDSLAELQKYQNIVRLAAVAEWRKANPGEDAPSDLGDSISLTIEKLDEGSADVFLAFEQHQEYVHLQEEAQEAVDSVIAAAYSDSEIPTLPTQTPIEAFEFRTLVAQFGKTLQDGQSIEFYADTTDSDPVSISVHTMEQATEKLLAVDDLLLNDWEEPPKPKIDKETSSLVGKVTALDTDKMYYHFTLDDGQQLKGYYKTNPELLEDLRQVVNDASEGPITRITGTLQYKNGNLFRFWETTSIDQVQFDDTDWGRRLSEFAGLRTNWDGHDAAQISPVALDAAQTLLRSITEMNIKRPGVFPTIEGGVLLEWGSAASVSSVELLEDGSFESFLLIQGESEGLHASGENLDEAVEFIKAARK